MSVNTSASIKQRLLNRARNQGEDFNALMSRYVGLRFLHRLAESRFSDKFVLKGATLFLIWSEDTVRPTRDVDLLGLVGADIPEMERGMAEICEQRVEPDGLVFHSNTVRIEAIRRETPYGGVRCGMDVSLGTARLALQIDIGYGDGVAVVPSVVSIPSLLDGELERRILAYRMETAIAEKFETLVVLGLGKSRMKDFYDLEWLLQAPGLDLDALATSLVETFRRRQTGLPVEIPTALSAGFWTNPLVNQRWESFCRKNRLPESTLESTCTRIWSLIEETVHIARDLDGPTMPPR